MPHRALASTVVPYRLAFRGQVTREHVLAATSASQGALHGAHVLIDCLAVEDYDLDAREAFVAWMRQSRPKRVAFVLDKPLWRMVVRAMSMASSVPMHAFERVADAEAWLAT